VFAIIRCKRAPCLVSPFVRLSACSNVRMDFHNILYWGVLLKFVIGFGIPGQPRNHVGGILRIDVIIQPDRRHTLRLLTSDDCDVTGAIRKSQRSNIDQPTRIVTVRTFHNLFLLFPSFILSFYLSIFLSLFVSLFLSECTRPNGSGIQPKC
jgi:hypothetical protein